MKDRSTLVFTGDIGFDRYMYGKWDDDGLLSEDILGFLHSADHVVANVIVPVAEKRRSKERRSRRMRDFVCFAMSLHPFI